MTLDEIYEEWGKDVKIDRSDLGNESLKIPLLHHKWFKVFSVERKKHRILSGKLRDLEFRKKQFYEEGPTKETQALGWRMPSRGKILPTAVKGYVEADPDVRDMAEKVAEQAEIVDVVENIIKSINNRGYLIKDIIQWNLFINGVK